MAALQGITNWRVELRSARFVELSQTRRWNNDARWRGSRAEARDSKSPVIEGKPESSLPGGVFLRDVCNTRSPRPAILFTPRRVPGEIWIPRRKTRRTVKRSLLWRSLLRSDPSLANLSSRSFAETEFSFVCFSFGIWRGRRISRKESAIYSEWCLICYWRTSFPSVTFQVCCAQFTLALIRFFLNFLIIIFLQN